MAPVFTANVLHGRCDDGADAVLPEPPLTVAPVPLAVPLTPPLTVALSPLAVLREPPLTEDSGPFAMLPKPPATDEPVPACGSFGSPAVLA